MNTDSLNELERGIADTSHYPLLRLLPPVNRMLSMRRNKKIQRFVIV